MPASVPDHALCVGCNYALRGLADFRCPECGRPFDPRDGGTIVYTGWYNPVLYWLPGWCAAALLVAFVSLMLVVADAPWLIPGVAIPAAVGLVRHYGFGDISAGWCLGVLVALTGTSMIVGGPFLTLGSALLAVPSMFAGCVAGDVVRATMKALDYPQARWLP